MGRELNIEGLLLRMVIAIVDNPDEVHIACVATKDGKSFTVTVAPTDVGKLIGKDGRNASALRTLLSAIGVTAKEQYVLNIVTGRTVPAKVAAQRP
jgi:predicted RNA-binding protein YlqC (UPF0109 family)